VRRPGPTTFDVEGSLGVDRTVTLRRWPVVSRHHTEARGFYVVDEAETLPLWPLSAEVMVRSVTDAEVMPTEWLQSTLKRYPGLTVAVAVLGEDRCLVGLRNGRTLEADAPHQWGAPRFALDPVLLGAAMNVWLTDGEQSDDLDHGLTYCAASGRRRCDCVRSRPSDGAGAGADLYEGGLRRRVRLRSRAGLRGRSGECSNRRRSARCRGRRRGPRRRRPGVGEGQLDPVGGLQVTGEGGSDRAGLFVAGHGQEGGGAAVGLHAEEVEAGFGVG